MGPPDTFIYGMQLEARWSDESARTLEPLPPQAAPEGAAAPSPWPRLRRLSTALHDIAWWLSRRRAH